MAVQLTDADARRLAREAGQRGEALPAWAKGNPAWVAAYDQGTGAKDKPAAKPATETSTAPAEGGKDSRPASGRKATSRARTRRRKGYLDRAFSPSRAANRVGVGVIRAGDGGGLLLAILVYPLVLATLQHGSRGPALWFRAKWLNQTGDGSIYANRYDPSAPDGIPYWIEGPDGQRYPLLNPDGTPNTSGTWDGTGNSPPIPGWPRPDPGGTSA